MRIVIAKKLLSAVGGSELQARLLGRALAVRGHDVTLVGLRPPWPRPGIPTSPGAGPIETFEAGVRCVFLPARGGAITAVADGVLPTSFAADARALARMAQGADVVHSIAREWAAVLERVARSAGAAFVETPLVHPGQRFAGGGASDVARYRRADAILALTEWEADWYRAHGVASVHVTGIGAALSVTSDALMETARVLFVGRKEKYKGYHALRRAAPMVWQVRPDVVFEAIGQRAWGARFERMLADPRWIERGVVDEREKAEAYARATVLAMPSDHETFGHTYLEAWTAGRPVIAGDIPPLREVVREGIDGLHARNEPRAIADAILRLVRDPAAARRMGEAGRARVEEKWTWPIVAELTERAYAHARGQAMASTMRRTGPERSFLSA
ncbi:MAG: glycosyltransferase family 4 protein [Chloroflexi bacterium]|nr:glycosyltransferase family 4 protein [Chloroflexota bacterium]